MAQGTSQVDSHQHRGEGEIAITKSGKKMSKWYYDAISLPKEERQRLRSKTFQGIADAMADQWG